MDIGEPERVITVEPLRMPAEPPQPAPAPAEPTPAEPARELDPAGPSGPTP